MASGREADLTEEAVTLAILAELRRASWAIVTYDFPQSGTGTLLRPDSAVTAGDKVKGGIIPDVVAVHSGVCLVLENKPRYSEMDVAKLRRVKETAAFDRAFARLLHDLNVERMRFGIGLPLGEARANKSAIITHLDICLGVDSNSAVQVVAPLGVTLFLPRDIP